MEFTKNDARLQGFDAPTDLPASEQQASAWQEANRTWWESHPMRYDWNKSVGHEEFSAPFYDEIDTRFFSEVRRMMPWTRIPFDPLIDFDAIRNQDVLEIGVGNGSHAELLARHARSFTGIDLTEYAARSTAARLKVRGLPGAVQQMDAERMDFPDNSFDFIWSWGVIHHSSNTLQIVRQMQRVLRPGGRATIMVYNRSLWNYYFLLGFMHGIVRGKLFKFGSLHKVAQSFTDGAIARYFTGGEWATFVSDCFVTNRTCVYGAKPELIPMPGGKLKNAVMACIPNAFSRFFLNSCRMGQFLVAEMTARKG